MYSKDTRALTFQHFFTADGSVLIFSANGGAEARDGEAGAGAGAGEGGGAGAGWSKGKTHSLFVLSGHRSQVMHVRWSPRHHYLYAQTSDGQVYVWLLHTSKPAELLRKISRLDAPLVLQALETPSSSIPQHTDGELAKNETADDSKLFGNGVGGGGAGAGGLGLSGGFFEENEENDEGLLPIEKRSLALHHPGTGGTGRGEYLSVIMLRCHEIAAAVNIGPTKQADSTPATHFGERTLTSEASMSLSSGAPMSLPSLGEGGVASPAVSGKIERQDTVSEVLHTVSL